MMKKVICVILSLMLFCCFTACNFTQKVSGSLAGKSESVSKVEEMLDCLVQNRVSDAKGLMHADIDEDMTSSFVQMINYLDGRKVNSIEQDSIKVNTSTGASGKVRQEQVRFLVTLSDGELFVLDEIYLSDGNSAGFISFNIVLGIV